MTRNNVLLIISAIIVLGGSVYYFFFFNGPSEPALSAAGLPAGDVELSFISLVVKIDPVVFDTKLLSDPRFTSLTDIRTIVLPEAAGRTDPFAPIVGVPTATTNTLR